MNASAMLIALTFVATASVSAQQWISGNNQQPSPYSSVVTTNISDMPAEASSQQQGYTITLNQNGDLQGQIDSNAFHRPISSNLKVYLLRNGEIAYQTQTDLAGRFELQRVDQGPYSFVVTAPTGFAAYGVYVRGNTDGRYNANVMEAAIVSPQITGIERVLQENLPAQIAGEIMQAAQQNVQPAAANGLKKIRLINGQLHGQITSLSMQGRQVPGTIVNVIQNGMRVADVEVDAQGNFKVPDLEPGAYDFIAVGYKGIAAIRFEAISQNSPITQVGYKRTPKLIATMLVLTLTDPVSNSKVDDSVSYSTEGGSYPVYDATVEYAGETTSYGAAGGGTLGSQGSYPVYSAPVRGGGGFGGGAVARGGSISGLAGIAGIAVGATALATNNNKNDGHGGGYPPPPPPQSPHGGYGGGYGGYFGGGYGGYGN